MGLPPLFLMETEMAVGGSDWPGPAFTEAPTTEMLALAVALSMRL